MRTMRRIARDKAAMEKQARDRYLLAATTAAVTPAAPAAEPPPKFDRGYIVL